MNCISMILRRCCWIWYQSNLQATWSGS